MASHNLPLAPLHAACDTGAQGPSHIVYGFFKISSYPGTQCLKSESGFQATFRDLCSSWFPGSNYTGRNTKHELKLVGLK